jgi:hypothetical protein
MSREAIKNHLLSVLLFFMVNEAASHPIGASLLGLMRQQPYSKRSE